MKIRIEIDNTVCEDEVVIKCRQITGSIRKIERFISEEASGAPNITLYKNNEEYFLPLDGILFFETGGDFVFAHTADDAFRVKLKLFELEDILSPHSFARISKSAIININRILSIDRNISSASLIQFYKSHKQVYVSRSYYKNLRQRLDERSHYEI
ncbi:MAG: LytTR family transcriptional regulator [Oscillospiraceae bacterium]|nr:LytTR family transcriptional regulator [Oscillospiraceae bacterium]